ncbi:receptor-type tyrosine-protein phosphatase epsilon-like [Saccostrea echinata]|uniref:receptor-type tyrosine-protein phosphatase epsilon-like n=1 Tax=Saccostrea echinata TaxID=191078 RepID=UPI002A823B5F|nr:receptor-type tyrosine-protein phosphatase epsilon-like [Saccostrea echinata]
MCNSKGCPDMNLKVIECTSWTEKLSSSNRKVLLDVVNEIGYENIRSDSKLLVLSSDGAKRCGPFCVVYNAVQQISLDREVDIFVITRLLQLRRPEFISTWEEYEFCNDVLADFIQNGLVYANSRYRSIRNTLISFIR